MARQESEIYSVGKHVMQEALIHKGRDGKREKTWLSLTKLHMQSPLNQQSHFWESIQKLHCQTMKRHIYMIMHFSIICNNKRMKSNQLFIITELLEKTCVISVQ